MSMSSVKGSFRESRRHVSYSCGYCGYDLNLSSSDRNTTSIGSKYGKSMKRGIICFLQIDETRFMKVEQMRCTPYFISKWSWGLFRRKTNLLCRKCGNHIGSAYGVNPPTNPDDGSTPTPIHTQFDIRIRCLQPSSSSSGTPLLI